jgi:phage terminase small subunit
VGRAKAKRGALNERERRFVEAFMGVCAGNATAAATRAGYSRKTARVQGAQLLAKLNIRRAIEARVAADPLVAKKDELQAWWTAIMQGRGRYRKAPLSLRLRASELLGKSQRVFVTVLDAAEGGTLAELLAQKPLTP